MYELKPLNQKIFRSRIDGANFTALIPFDPDDFQKKEVKSLKYPEKSKQLFDLNSLLRLYEKRIVSVFGFSEKNVFYRSNGLVIKDVHHLGFYCDISTQGYDIKIYLQFKGLFFIQDDAYMKMKLYLQELSAELDAYFRLTLIDIARDITLKPWEILPYKQEQLEHYTYNFRHKFRFYSERKGQKLIETGFELQSGRFKVKIYDKRHENEAHKNEEKKKYYRNLYQQFVSDQGEDLPISRFELTLRQEYCYDYSDSIYDMSISEERLVHALLNRFAQKHSLRTKPELFYDKSPKRWPITQNWVDLFCQTEDTLKPVKTPSDYRTSNPQKNIDSLVEQLAEAISMSDELSSKNEDPSKLLRVTDEMTKKAIEKAQKKKFEHEKSKRSQDLKINKIKQRFNQSQLNLLGDDL